MVMLHWYNYRCSSIYMTVAFWKRSRRGCDGIHWAEFPHKNWWKSRDLLQRVSVFLPLLKLFVLCSTVHQSSVAPDFSCNSRCTKRLHCCTTFSFPLCIPWMCYTQYSTLLLPLNSQSARKQCVLQWILLIQSCLD
jgi:hypothetical protein